MIKELRAPFPYMGGKFKVAKKVWEIFGNVRYYIEPFCGSAAVLLARPKSHIESTTRLNETLNDKDGFIINVWRSIRNNPNQVIGYLDVPYSHDECVARHTYIMKNDINIKVREDCDFYDTKIAAYWLYGRGMWGADRGWCTLLSNGKVSEKNPTFQNEGIVKFTQDEVREVIELLCERLRNVNIYNVPWYNSILNKYIESDSCGIFLDPPYDHERRDKNIYRIEENVSKNVNKWCAYYKDRRIILCGVKGEHDNLGWQQIEWSNHIGVTTEILYISPGCRWRQEKVQ